MVLAKITITEPLEAAALFIGGLVLTTAGHQGASEWGKLGRYWLVIRAISLIAVDGSFSQHSLNYHRMMLDTFCFAEISRRDFESPFSADCVRASSATNWLYQMVFK